MITKITYKTTVIKDLKRIDKQEARRVINKMEKVLSENPDAGTALTGEFQGLFRYRAGDYRAIYSKRPGQVLVLRIAHRKEVYRSVPPS
ncbi:MAG: type II toxin-antitoxin system RelE/ParE family toxin [bacterium]|nr:type II toxin-antitoxin system RelE/ParE family toxin [bacterium]